VKKARPSKHLVSCHLMMFFFVVRREKNWELASERSRGPISEGRESLGNI
jgi:hypothetical protein